MAPIKPPEFARLLRTVLDKSARKGQQETKIPKRIGLAISGGIDSMALAHLSRQLQGFENDFRNTEFHAIIVDHGIRQESANEARNVKQVLKNLGLKTHLRTLKYDFNKAGKKLETIARAQRYRMLAKICLENDISHLITGHHANDQAETVFMRLISGTGPAGLAGMQSVTSIPECGRVFGADDIVVLRPFLGVAKDHLQATLVKERVKWFHDKSNDDVGLTPRNAIRALLAKPKHLPKVLQTQSLLALSERALQRNQKVDDNVEWYLSRCRIRHVRESGVAEILIPPNLLEFPPEFLARVLGRLAEVVSPLERVDMIQMTRVAESVIGTLNPSLPPQLLMKNPKLKIEDLKNNYSFSSQPTHYAGGAMTENNVFWEMAYCRALHGNEAGVLVQCYRQPYVRYTRTQPSSAPETVIDPEDPNKWVLWDGRFWIRYSGSVDDKIWVRARELKVKRVFITGTRKEVMYQVEKGEWMDMREYNILKKRFKIDAPSKSRTVLPIICEESTRPQKLWKVPYVPLYMPTFQAGAEEGKGKWDWKPKKDLVVMGQLIGSRPVKLVEELR